MLIIGVLVIISFHTSLGLPLSMESLFTLEEIVHWKAYKSENQAFCDSKESGYTPWHSANKSQRLLNSLAGFLSCMVWKARVWMTAKMILPFGGHNSAGDIVWSNKGRWKISCLELVFTLLKVYFSLTVVTVQLKPADRWLLARKYIWDLQSRNKLSC